MRNAAREAALNIIFAQQFNSDCMDSLKKKIYKFTSSFRRIEYGKELCKERDTGVQPN